MERVFVAEDYSPRDGIPLAQESARHMYLFEDRNNQTERPKVILRVHYLKHKNAGDAEANHVTKFHTLMLMDSENQPSPIYRNHKYIINISGLPWEGLGYSSFEDALKGTDYSNNRTVNIDQRVGEVNDGKFRLLISGQTSLIFNDESQRETQQTVNFVYEAVPGAGGSVAGITADNFTAEWTEPVESSFASSTVTVNSYDASKGQGSFTFTLGTSINTVLQSGTIRLSDKNSGLSRYVNVYTITQFSPQVEQLTRTGDSRTVAGITCPTYKLTFKIPKEYPAGLYPIVVRMASTTLNPFKVLRNGVDNTSVSVVIESTENGAIVENIELSGMDFATAGSAWNYRAQGSPWNYWYTYTIVNKPEQTGTEEDDDECTVYFDDVRPLRAEANRSSDVGLFIWMKHFGPAVAIHTSD